MSRCASTGDKVVARDATLFELPPGHYRVRVVLASGQIYEDPAMLKIERQRVTQYTARPAAQRVSIDLRPNPPSQSSLEIWSAGQLIAKYDLTFVVYTELLAGDYVVKVITPRETTEKKFVALAGPDVAKWMPSR